MQTSHALKPLLLLIAGAASPAAAEQEVPCVDRATTPEINQCLAEVSSRVESALEEAAARVAEKFQSIDAAEPMFKPARTFRESQQLWKAHRDAECKAKSELLTVGTGAPAAYARCKIRLTQLRIDALDPRLWPPQ